MSNRFRVTILLLLVIVAQRAVHSAEAPSSAPSGSAGSASLMTSSPNLLADMLDQLSPDNLRAFGEMLDKDWSDRPEWGAQLVAMLKGGGMGAGSGWWHGADKRYDYSWLLEKADKNADQAVSRAEFAEKFAGRETLFRRLDRDLDGQLTAAEFDWSESAAVTPRAAMASTLFSRLDVDSNGRVTPDELTEFLKQSDRDQLGFLTSEDLFAAVNPEMQRGGEGRPDVRRMVRMFLRGELGQFTSGPALGEEAPDFSLPTYDGAKRYRLSEMRGRPVVLIFGSFT